MKNLEKILFFVVSLLLMPFQTYAQHNSIRTGVCYFRPLAKNVDLSFRDNRQQMDSAVSTIMLLRQHASIERIHIVSSASPEGSDRLNNRLSRYRGQAVYSFLQERLHLPDSLFSVESLGQDWDRLCYMLEESDLSYKDQVLHIIRNVPDLVVQDGNIVDSRKRQLMELQRGRVWRDMVRRIFPELRSGVVIAVVYARHAQLPAVSEYISLSDMIPFTPSRKHLEVPLYGERSFVASPVLSRKRGPFYVGIRNNMLYDALTIPNIGLEWYLGKKWSLVASWAYAWWKNDHNHRYWRVYGGELAARRYMGKKATEKPLAGHHLGVYGQGLTYDFELKHTGNLSDFSYAVGVEYGYTLPVRKRLNLDFSLGLGYLGGEYKEYEPIDQCYVWQATKKRHWFGPTKAEISLVWLLGCCNVNKHFVK